MCIRLLRGLPRVLALVLAAGLLAAASTAADVYRCPAADGQQHFQDHPCGNERQAVAANANTTTRTETLAAKQACEAWSQLGYVAAVARDRGESQQSLLDRHERDGLDDGARTAIAWAYRDYQSKPEQIKQQIRADCLLERLQEKPTQLFGGKRHVEPGDFILGEHRYRMHLPTPWVIDYTRSGKQDAAIYLFIQGADPGKMVVNCQASERQLSAEAIDQQLLSTALTGSSRRTELPYPKIERVDFADGSISHVSLPLPPVTGSPELVLKQPRHVVHGMLEKNGLRCSFRIDTYLPHGESQSTGIRAMLNIFPAPDTP